jgi:ribose transport system permease protein
MTKTSNYNDTTQGSIERSKFNLKDFIRDYLAFILLFALLVSASCISNVFLSVSNIFNILRAVSILGIVALGQTILLLTGNFDLSVSSVVSFTGILVIGLMLLGCGPLIAIIFGIIGGSLVGLLNGYIVVKTKASAFLITFGTQTLVYALAQIITNAQTWYGTNPKFNLIGQGMLWGWLPIPVVIFIGLAIILQIILKYTVFGRSLFAIGTNEEAVKMSGIKTNYIKIVAFISCSSLAAFAGYLMCSRLNSTRASGSVGMDFDSTIAAVLGGTSLFGGRGGALKTVAGVVTLGVLNNILVLMNMPYEAQKIIKGLVFLGVVGIDSILRMW